MTNKEISHNPEFLDFMEKHELYNVLSTENTIKIRDKQRNYNDINVDFKEQTITFVDKLSHRFPYPLTELPKAIKEFEKILSKK